MGALTPIPEGAVQRLAPMLKEARSPVHEGKEDLRDKLRGGRYHAHLTREEEQTLLAPFLEQARRGVDGHCCSGATNLREPGGSPGSPLGYLPGAASSRLAQGPAASPASEDRSCRPGRVQKKFPVLVQMEVN